MQFQNGGGVFQVAIFGFAAVGLDFAKLIERLVELTGEAMSVHAEIREQTLLAAESLFNGTAGLDVGEVNIDAAGGEGGGEHEDVAFEEGGAIQAPGRIGEAL